VRFDLSGGTSTLQRTFLSCVLVGGGIIGG
jgi:hypothetical protein